MATPVFLPDTQFDAFGVLGLTRFSDGVDLGTANFTGANFVFARLSAVNSSGSFVERPSSGVIKAQKWSAGWIVLKANGAVVAFSRVASGEPVIRTDLPAGFQSDVVDISASGSYAVAIKSDGSLVEWNFANSSFSSALPSGNGFTGVSVAVYAGFYGNAISAVAVRGDGSVVTWGDAITPSAPSGLGGVISICVTRTSYYYPTFLALKRDGTLVAWDVNGISSDANIVSLSRIVHISKNREGGRQQFFAIDDSGQVWSTLGGSQQIYAVSGADGYFLRNDGRVVEWMDGLQVDLLSGIDGIYTGSYIRRDGSILLWERPINSSGEVYGSGIQYMLPLGLRVSVNSLGSNDFSFVYDGTVKSVTPNYERPLGRRVVAATITPANPKNVGSYSILYSISDASYKIATADAVGTLAITAGVPIIIAGQIFTGKVGSVFESNYGLGHMIVRPSDSQNRPITGWTITGLPTGLSALSNSISGGYPAEDFGIIYGTPQDSGSATITLTATGPGGTSEPTTATISIAVGPPMITAGQSFSGKVGVAFSATPALTDAMNRPATSWSAMGLPAGLSLNATTGAITGTPTAKGSFTATFTAIGAGGTGEEASVAFTISEGVPIITAGQSFSGKVAALFNRTPELTDAANRPATSWAATGLPSWATLNPTTGEITGTPQDSGSTTIMLTATGPGGTSDAVTATISIAVGPPFITIGQSFSGKVGVAFSATPTLEDALDRPATSWSATGLPAGLSLNATTGAITGTPTAKGSFQARFTATGGGGTGGARSVDFTISEGVPIITAGQTLSGSVGAAFNRTPTLTDAANRPVTSWAATDLPSWATLNPTTGEITGTPQDSGSTTITLTATGPGGTSEPTTATISIVPALMITWPGVSVRVGQAVSFFAVTGVLPSGIVSGRDYYVAATLPGGKFTISAVAGGNLVPFTGQSATGSYKGRLKSRAVRGEPTEIQYIGMKPGNGPEWEVDTNSIGLWGYNASPSSATIARPLKAEDIEYADMVAQDWVIPGVSRPPEEGTLRSELAVKHVLSGGRYVANWPGGNEVLVDLDGRNLVDVGGVTLGECSIVPGFTGRLGVAMLSWLDGVRGYGGNLCSLYVKFFASHASQGIDLYRSGGGDGWQEVLAFGAPGDVVSEASVPVGGAALVLYKLVRGQIGSGVLSVSLRIKLIQ